MNRIGTMGWKVKWAVLAVLFAVQMPLMAVGYRYGAKIGGVTVHYVSVDLNNPNLTITPMVASTFPYGCERFESMLWRTRPTAAVTGTFFNLSTLQPVGDIVIEGIPIWRGKLRTALVVTTDGRVTFVTLPNGSFSRLAGVRSLLACGPRLLWSGRVAVYPEWEGFRDRGVLRRARRSVAGVTRNGKLLLTVVSSPVTLTECAKVMRALGCVEAMNLDGGTSTGLYCTAKMLVRPGRPLTNALLVFDNRATYAQARYQLAPYLWAYLGFGGLGVMPAFASPRETGAVPLTQSPTSCIMPTPSMTMTPSLTSHLTATPSPTALSRNTGNGDEKTPLPASGVMVVELDPAVRSKVSYASYFVDGILKLITNVPPYQFIWDTSKYSNGEHVVKVKVTGKFGERVYEQERKYDVRN